MSNDRDNEMIVSALRDNLDATKEASREMVDIKIAVKGVSVEQKNNKSEIDRSRDRIEKLEHRTTRNEGKFEEIATLKVQLNKAREDLDKARESLSKAKGFSEAGKNWWVLFFQWAGLIIVVLGGISGFVFGLISALKD